MKTIVVLLASLITFTASAQVRAVVVAAERQLQHPRVMVYTGVRANIMPTNRYSYAIPYAGIASHSYATYNDSYSSVSENSDTIIWPYIMLGFGALGLLYLVFSEFYVKKRGMTTFKGEPYCTYYQACTPRPCIVELANSGGILIRG